MGACSCLMAVLKAIGAAIMYLFSLLTYCIRAMPIAAVSMMLRVLNIGNAVLLASACAFIFIYASSSGPALNPTQVRHSADSLRAPSSLRLPPPLSTPERARTPTPARLPASTARTSPDLPRRVHGLLRLPAFLL